MSTTPNEKKDPAAAPPSAVKRIIPMVLAGSIGLSLGGAAGALVAGPVMAEKAVAHAEVVAEDVVAKVASGEHASSKKGEGKKGEGEHGEGAAAGVYKVENLVLNPAQSGGTRFLVATLALEVADEATSESMKPRDAEVRDAILRILGAKTVNQLSDMAGREELKTELRTAVDSIFGEETVHAVYMPQFVIQ